MRGEQIFNGELGNRISYTPFEGEQPEMPFEMKSVELAWVVDVLQKLMYTVGAIDRMRSLEDVRLGDAGTVASQTLHALQVVTDVQRAWSMVRGIEGYGNLSLEDFPEFFLVLRLRMLNVSWARIAESMDINPAGVHKRWGKLVDQVLA